MSFLEVTKVLCSRSQRGSRGRQQVVTAHNILSDSGALILRTSRLLPLGERILPRLQPLCGNSVAQNCGIYIKRIPNHVRTGCLSANSSSPYFPMAPTSGVPETLIIISLIQLVSSYH